MISMSSFFFFSVNRCEAYLNRDREGELNLATCSKTATATREGSLIPRLHCEDYRMARPSSLECSAHVREEGSKNVNMVAPWRRCQCHQKWPSQKKPNQPSSLLPTPTNASCYRGLDNRLLNTITEHCQLHVQSQKHKVDRLVQRHQKRPSQKKAHSSFHLSSGVLAVHTHTPHLATTPFATSHPRIPALAGHAPLRVFTTSHRFHCSKLNNQKAQKVNTNHPREDIPKV